MAKETLGVIGIAKSIDPAFLEEKINGLHAKLVNTKFENFITTDEVGVAAQFKARCNARNEACRVVKTNHERDGRAAKYVRDDTVIKNCNLLVCFWDKKCAFVERAINARFDAGKRVLVIWCEEPVILEQ